MIYLYECPECGEVYDPVQSMEGDHREYPCKCGVMAKRVYTSATAPSMKLNAGFESDELGVAVKGTKEYDELKARQRYINGLVPFLGDNQSPKQEWVDEMAKKDAELDRAAREHDEQAEYSKHYTSVETFTDTNRKQ